MASFDLAGRGYVFDTARRAPAHRADRRPHLAGVRLLLQRRRAARHRRASTARSGCGTRAPPRPRSRATSPTTLCREFGSRIDADSWELAFERRGVRDPLPRSGPVRHPRRSRSRPRPTSARCRGEHPRTVAFQDTFEGASAFGPASSSSRPAPSPPRSGAAATAWRSPASVRATRLGSRPRHRRRRHWAVGSHQGRSRASAASTVSDGTTQLSRSPSTATAGTGTMGWFSRTRQHPQRAVHGSRRRRRRRCPWSTTAACSPCSSGPPGRDRRRPRAQAAHLRRRGHPRRRGQLRLRRPHAHDRALTGDRGSSRTPSPWRRSPPCW